MQESAWQIQDSARQCMRLQVATQYTTMQDNAGLCGTVQYFASRRETGEGQCKTLQDSA
jgi:hypothetical protein